MKQTAIAAICAIFTLSATSLMAQQGPKIGFEKNVSLNVGQSLVIYGYRGECGSLPSRNAVQVPATKTGKITFGRDGWRISKKCGGATPAVELVFTAVSPGRGSVAQIPSGIHLVNPAW